MEQPSLRFKTDDGSDFPEWEEKTLGELCAPLTYGMNAAATKFDGENRYIRITDIDDETHALLPNDIVSPSGELDDKYLVKKGDILLARTGASTGKSFLYHPKDGKLFYAGFLIKAHVLPSSDDYFIYSQTLTDRYWKWVKTASMRSGQPGINANEYASYSFAVPSFPEQRKIADFLSAVDAVIAAQQAEVDAWEQRKKGVMQKLFSQEVRFKADDGSEFPDWEEKTLGEEGQFYGGLSGKGKDDFDCGNGRFVTYMNVYKNAFASRDAMGRVKVGDAEKQNKVRYGDILFTQSSETVDEVGLSSVYLYNDEPYLNSFCMGYRFNNLDNVCPEFIGYCMRSNEIRKSIMLMGQGISRINLGAKRLATVKYKIPSLSEQRKIADCLTSMDEVIQKSKGELAKWQELKKGLLQQMFV